VPNLNWGNGLRLILRPSDLELTARGILPPTHTSAAAAIWTPGAPTPPAPTGSRPEPPRYYLVDVSVHGRKGIPVERLLGNADDVFRYSGPPFPPKEHLIEIAFDDVSDPKIFAGCSARCSGVNWCCDNNRSPKRCLG
jgi:hypothetical protein